MECDAIRIASASSHTCCSAKRACLPWTAWVGTSHPKTPSFHTCSDISNIFPPAKSWLHKLGNWVQIWWKMMKKVTWPFKFYFLKTSPKASSLRRRRIDAQLCFQFPPENQHILIPYLFDTWNLQIPACLPTLPEGSRGCFSFKNFKASSALRLWTNFMRSSSEVGFGCDVRELNI